MNILFIIEVKIRKLINWSYRFPIIILIIEPRTVNRFEHVVQFLSNAFSFGVRS